MRVVIMVMLIMLLILSGTNNDIDGTDNIISAKEGTQVSVLVVLIMMFVTIMITSIDDELVVTNGCCFGGDGNGLCDVRHDMRNWLVTPKSEKKILRTVLTLILTTFDEYRLKRLART